MRELVAARLSAAVTATAEDHTAHVEVEQCREREAAAAREERSVAAVAEQAPLKAGRAGIKVAGGMAAEDMARAVLAAVALMVILVLVR